MNASDFQINTDYYDFDFLKLDNYNKILDYIGKFLIAKYIENKNNKIENINDIIYTEEIGIRNYCDFYYIDINTSLPISYIILTNNFIMKNNYLKFLI